MRLSKTYRTVALYAVLVSLFTVKDARAYIDPNSAGLLYQIFFPVVLALTLTWRWIKEMFKQLWTRVTRKAAE